MEKNFISYKKDSRKDWGTEKEGEGLTMDQIRTGALLRIADSLENIEEPYKKLIQQNEWLSRRHKVLRAENERLRNSNAGYKSWVTRLKNKIEDK